MTISIFGAGIRFDENGTAHTDALGSVIGVYFQKWGRPYPWLCFHRPGEPQCPEPSITYGDIIRSWTELAESDA